VAVTAEAARPGALRIEGVPPDPQLIAALATWCASVDVGIVELRTMAGSLEERYFELTGDLDAGSVADMAPPGLGAGATRSTP
jgi:hypothetical protein